jgi:hypothetical protein
VGNFFEHQKNSKTIEMEFTNFLENHPLFSIIFLNKKKQVEIFFDLQIKFFLFNVVYILQH